MSEARRITLFTSGELTLADPSGLRLMTFDAMVSTAFQTVKELHLNDSLLRPDQVCKWTLVPDPILTILADTGYALQVDGWQFLLFTVSIALFIVNGWQQAFYLPFSCGAISQPRFSNHQNDSPGHECFLISRAALCLPYATVSELGYTLPATQSHLSLQLSSINLRRATPSLFINHHPQSLAQRHHHSCNNLLSISALPKPNLSPSIRQPILLFK